MCETKKILFICNIIVTDIRPNQGQARIFHKDRREKSVSAVDTVFHAEKFSQAYCQYVENVFLIKRCRRCA